MTEVEYFRKSTYRRELSLGDNSIRSSPINVSVRLQYSSTCQCLLTFRATVRPTFVGRLACFIVASFLASARVTVRPCSVYLLLSIMADHYCKDTAHATDSSQATGSMASSVSPPGLASKSVSDDASATAMVKFSMDLRDLEAAAALEAMGRVPETQAPGTEVSTLELSTDSEVTFRKVLGSSEILPTRPGVDPLDVTRPMADVSWASQSPSATSPSIITRQPTRTTPGPWPPASHVFGPSTTQVEPEDTRTFHTPDDPGSSHPQDPDSFHLSLRYGRLIWRNKYQLERY